MFNIGKVLLASLLCVYTAQAIPFITNGDFDSPPGLAPWTANAEASLATTQGVGGSNAALLRDGDGTNGAITQNVSGFVAGEVLDLTFDASVGTTGTSDADLGLLIDGLSQGTTTLTGNTFRRYRISNISATTGAHDVTLQNDTGNDILLDNIAFVPAGSGVPEIAAAAAVAPVAFLLGVGLLLGDRRRAFSYRL
jgi:hypothetical protein